MIEVKYERGEVIVNKKLTNAQSLPYLRKLARFLKAIGNDVPVKVTIKYYKKNGKKSKSK